jgi:hypothetical protein
VSAPRCILADHEDLPHPHEDNGDCDFFETGDLHCIKCQHPLRAEGRDLVCTGCERRQVEALA